MPRSPILRGLFLTLRHPRPLLWTYALSAATAWLASATLRAEFADVTSTTLAAQPLVSGFDLGTLFDAARRFSAGPHGGFAVPARTGIPVYLLAFFFLVPGTLLTYLTNAPLRLGSLLQQGLQSFWSFVRITLLTLLIAGPILGLLSAAQGAISAYIDDNITGEPAFVLDLLGLAIIFLVACLLRLYFDLVEIHTVDLAQTLRSNGKPDRRVRTTLRPAWHTFRARLPANAVTFVLLALLGGFAVYFCSLSALRHLAQPRVWPTALLAQLGVFLLIFTRFWQRAAESVHFRNVNPLLRRSRIYAPANLSPSPSIEPDMNSYASTFPGPFPVADPPSPFLPGPDSNPLPDPSPTPDPLPNPEPIAPSLASPDPGVFHHDVPAKKDLLN
jgi:hypothetical protein